MFRSDCCSTAEGLHSPMRLLFSSMRFRRITSISHSGLGAIEVAMATATVGLGQQDDQEAMG